MNDETRTRAETILHELFPTAQVRAEPDYTAAFFASPIGTDVCVIAGTGSLICSWSGRKIVKSGGRGYIIGDVGSGYQYGRDALIAYLDKPDAVSDVLKEAVVATFGSEFESEIVPCLYRSATPAMLLAKLMKAVAADAMNSAPYAIASIDRNTQALAEAVARHIETHIAKTEVSICLAGGIWKASTVFTSPFENHLRDLLPNRNINVQKISRPPLHGAVALAKELSRGN